MNATRRILLIDFTNYEDFPIGGYLTFARNMMSSFGRDLALVGITTSGDDPIGRWFKKTIDGIEFDFFAMIRYRNNKTKRIIPDRLVNYLLVKYYKQKILSIGINNIFLQRQESLLAVHKSGKNVCYSFAGMDNPLVNSKYRYGSLLATWFENRFFKKIGFAGTILGRGDNDAIRDMLARSNGALKGREVVKFPTRIDTSIFKPEPMIDARLKLGLAKDCVIVATTGRLAWWKGWKFMIDSFARFSQGFDKTLFVMVGEGEDYYKIKSYIADNKLNDKILLTGRKDRNQIALYLNAADVYIMGSYKEGWPTALMEAVACGVPACATDFSSVDEIIIEGVNGHIMRNRSEEQFAEAMASSLKLKRPVKNDHVTKYSTDSLKADILRYWELI